MRQIVPEGLAYGVVDSWWRFLMSRYLFPIFKPQILGALLAVIGLSGISLHGDESSSLARVLKHAQGDGQVVQALLFQLPEDSTGVVTHDHLIFVDTSASQVGAHRLRALAVLESMLKTLPETDRVRLFAVDVQAESLMPSFDGLASESLRSAITKLKSRIPLGATNLQAVVQTALESKAADRACSIVYIGDGMSTADLLEANEVIKMVVHLRDQQMPFHSYGVGPQINLLMLGILAHHTGGYVEFDRRIDADEPDAGQTLVATEWGVKLGQALQQPIAFVTQVELVSGATSSLPLLPLRTDRETIHLVLGALAADATVTMKTSDADKPMQWNVSVPQEQPNLACLAIIAKQSQKDDGLSNGLAGRALMQACQRWFAQSINAELQFGTQQLKQGHADRAAEIARQVAEVDPANPAAESLALESDKVRFRQVSQVTQPEGEVVGDSLLDSRTRPDPNASLIREQEQDIRVQTEKLRHRVNDAVGAAKSSDPETGLVLLKQARNALVAANDISPEDRTRMTKQLDLEINRLKNIKDKVEQERVHLSERLSQLESQKRLTEQFELDEETLEGLIERVRALMQEGKHGRDEAYGEAQNVADVAINLRPGEGTSAAARFDAEAAQQLNRAYRLRARRADQLLETLHQVELSHVPFPDEPPVRYPPADVWKALTERRRKWASVDLHRDNPREQRIQQELRSTTEVNFGDTPLKDALDYLKELHHVEIWPDLKTMSEEGISTETTVTLVLSGVTLRTVLRLMLEPLLLTYIIEDEVLKVTTQTVADEKMATRVYPVADLVVPIQSGMMGGGMRGGMGGGMGGMGGGMGGMGGGMMGGGMGGMGGGMGGGFF